MQMNVIKYDMFSRSIKRDTMLLTQDAVLTKFHLVLGAPDRKFILHNFVIPFSLMWPKPACHSRDCCLHIEPYSLLHAEFHDQAHTSFLALMRCVNSLWWSSSCLSWNGRQPEFNCKSSLIVSWNLIDVYTPSLNIVYKCKVQFWPVNQKKA